MQFAMIHMFSAGWFPARWAGALCFIAGFFDDLGLGQVFYSLKYRVRRILAGTMFGLWFGGCRCSFHLASLLHKTLLEHTSVGRHATVSTFPQYDHYHHFCEK